MNFRFRARVCEIFGRQWTVVLRRPICDEVLGVRLSRGTLCNVSLHSLVISNSGAENCLL